MYVLIPTPCENSSCGILTWGGGVGGRDGGETERNKHQSVASRTCPNQGSNLQPFGEQDDAPTNKPPGQGKRPLS